MIKDIQTQLEYEAVLVEEVSKLSDSFFEESFKMPKFHFRCRNRGSGNKSTLFKPKPIKYDKMYHKPKNPINQPRMRVLKHSIRHSWKPCEGEL